MTEEQTSRLNNIYNAREQAIARNNQEYDNLITSAGALKNEQDTKAEQMQQEQDRIADANLAYQQTIVNQYKEQATKDNRKERIKALNEYEFNTNPYGYQSETLASQGLTNSGVSDTMKLGMYGVYQNRVATANATLETAMTAYNQALLEAQKDNDVAKAQNALNKLQAQLQNAETYFNNYSGLTQNKLNQINSITNQYDNQYNTVYSQILQEKQQAEAIRQYNESMAYQRERDAIKDAQWQKEYNLSVSKSSSSSSGSSGSKNTGGITQQSDNTAKKALSSPNLSNTKASSYFASLAGNKALTKTQLATIVAQVDAKYSLSNKDRNIIYEAYGFVQ